MKIFTENPLPAKTILNESGSSVSLEIEDLNSDHISQELASGRRCAVLLGDDDSIAEILDLCAGLGNCAVIVFDSNLAAKESLFPCLLQAIKQGGIQKEAVVYAGSHSYDLLGYNFFRENRLKNYAMKEISVEGVQEVSDNILAATNKYAHAAVFIHERVAGGAGLTRRELIYFVQRIALLRNLRLLCLQSRESSLAIKLCSEFYQSYPNGLCGK